MGNIIPLNYFTSRFFTHYIYLNGENIPISSDLFEKENIDDITLYLIRQKLGPKLPDDAVLLQRQNEAYSEEEEKKITLKYLGNFDFGFQFFSKSLYEKNLLKVNKEPFIGLKLLEKVNDLDIYEYPQEKEEFDLITILALGDLKNFINGFLNFLFDIKNEDKYRLKLGNIDNEKNNFINKIYLKTKKGNFKFITINFKNNLKYEEIKQIIELLKEEKNINLLLLNNPIPYFLKSEKMDELVDIDIIKEEDKTQMFFIDKNYFNLYLKYFYYMKKSKFELNAHMNEINSEIMDEIKDLFFSEMINSEFLFENENNNMMRCLNVITQKGYSKFLQLIQKRINITIDLSNLISYLSYVLKKIEIFAFISYKNDTFKRDYESEENKKFPLIRDIDVHFQIQEYNKEIYEFNKEISLKYFKKYKSKNKPRWYEEVLIIYFGLFLMKERDTYDDDSDDECLIF